MRFEANKFEMLSGLDASRYALDLAATGVLQEEILPYFKQKRTTLDSSHLEVAVFLVAKVGTAESWRIVSEYLDHTDFRVRFVAIKLMKSQSVVDEVVMAKVVETLKRDGGDGLADELRVLLDRPANAEALRMASEFRQLLNHDGVPHKHIL